MTLHELSTSLTVVFHNVCTRPNAEIQEEVVAKFKRFMALQQPQRVSVEVEDWVRFLRFYAGNSGVADKFGEHLSRVIAHFGRATGRKYGLFPVFHK